MYGKNAIVSQSGRCKDAYCTIFNISVCLKLHKLNIGGKEAGAQEPEYASCL